MSHDVFISYCTEDKPVGDAVCSSLETHGARCWIAPRDVMPGRSYAEAIIDGIHGARIMVLVFSHHTNRSPHVEREVERAVGRGLIIIPFRIEDVLPERSLEYFLGTPHWLDAMSPPLERHLAYLAETVAAILRSEASVQPPSASDTRSAPSATRPSEPTGPHAPIAAGGWASPPWGAEAEQPRPPPAPSPPSTPRIAPPISPPIGPPVGPPIGPTLGPPAGPTPLSGVPAGPPKRSRSRPVRLTIAAVLLVGVVVLVLALRSSKSTSSTSTSGSPFTTVANTTASSADTTTPATTDNPVTTVTTAPSAFSPEEQKLTALLRFAGSCEGVANAPDASRWLMAGSLARVYCVPNQGTPDTQGAGTIQFDMYSFPNYDAVYQAYEAIVSDSKVPSSTGTCSTGNCETTYSPQGNPSQINGRILVWVGPWRTNPSKFRVVWEDQKRFVLSMITMDQTNYSLGVKLFADWSNG